MIYTNKYVKMCLILIVLFIVNCIDESLWWAVIIVDNQSKYTCEIVYKAYSQNSEKSVIIDSKSMSEDDISARRTSDKQKLSDNFAFLNVSVTNAPVILEYTEEKLDTLIIFQEEDGARDKYLLTITDEMIEAALADRVKDNIVE